MTYPHKVPTLVKATRICEDMNVDLALPRPYRSFLSCSWIQVSDMISTSLIGSGKTKVTASVAQQSFLIKVEESYNGYMQVFTDGSKQLKGRVGAAIFVPEYHYSKGWRLECGHSVFMAELFAILQCLLWVFHSNFNRCFVIFTDSMAALTLLARGSQKSHRRISTKIL